MFPRILRPLSIVACLLAAAVASSQVHAAITATIAEGGTRGEWAMVALEFPTLKSAGEIELRDSRGGLCIVRTLSAGEHTATFSMPLIAPAELAGGPWTLDARLLGGGKLLEQTRLSLQLPAQQETFRLAVRRGTPAQVVASLPRIGPVSVIEMSDEDFLESSPIVFAACDGVLLAPAMHDKLGSARRLALLGAGIQLITSGDSSATPATPLRRPHLIVPELSQLETPSIEPQRSVAIALLLVAPAAVIAALIARGLFKKPFSIHLAVTGAMLIVPAAMILYLHHADAPLKTGFHLSEASVALADPGDGAMLDEQFFAQGTLLGGSFAFEPPAGSAVLPQFSSARAYFSAPPMRLNLSNPQTLQGQQRGRQVNWFVQLSGDRIPTKPDAPRGDISKEDLLKRWRIDPSRAWWVTGGYVTPANAAAAQSEGVLITKWAQQQSPSITRAARAWESLRLQGTHDYLLWTEDASDKLNVIDLGPAKQ